MRHGTGDSAPCRLTPGRIREVEYVDEEQLQ
jgi:hypothetical protein